MPRSRTQAGTARSPILDPGAARRRRRIALCWLALAASPLVAAAQLAPGNATVFRLPVNEDWGMGAALAAGDFDGDGADDLAMGAPLATDGGQVASGAVVLRYGNGSVAFLAQSTSGLGVPESGDRFGAALAAGDIDCDGFDDLAVGVVWEDFGGFLDTGAVFVYYGGPAGLPAGAGDLLLLSDVDAGGNQNFADFGSSLAVLEYGGGAELAIGCPGHDVPLANDSGAVFVVPHACPGGGFEIGNTLPLVQGSGGVAGVASSDDDFGRALAVGDFDGLGGPDLAVGIPGNQYGGGAYGSIQVFYGAGTALAVGGNAVWYQDDAGVPGTAEDGDEFGAALASADFDGDGYDDVAVGVPGEDVGATVDAGSVNVLYGSAAGIGGDGAQSFDQSNSGVPGAAETSDRFGGALAAGDFDGEGRADLAIGVPREDVGPFADAGYVDVLYGTPTGLLTVRAQGFDEDALPAPGANGNSDFFGSALATIDLDGDGIRDLIATAPFDHFNGFSVGLVAVIPGGPLFSDGFESGDTTAWSLTEP